MPSAQSTGRSSPSFLLILILCACATPATGKCDVPMQTFTVEHSGGESIDGWKPESLAGTYSYDVLLPPNYEERPDCRFPCIFVMSPGGNAKTGALADILPALGWVGIFLKEARNGPWEPIMGNFIAAHDDAVARFRIAEGAKFVTGFSGGARGSSLFLALRPGFRGIIAQGAGFAYLEGSEYFKAGFRSDVAHFGVFGDADANLVEAKSLYDQMTPAQRERSRWIVFPGKHSRAPAVLMRDAIDFMELHLLACGAKPVPAVSAWEALAERWLTGISSGRLGKASAWRAAEAFDMAIKNDPSLASGKFGKALQSLQSDLRRLRSDATYLLEIEAEEAYWEALDAVAAASMGAPFKSPAVLASFRKRTAESLASVAARHPATEFGARAEAAASEFLPGTD